MPAAPPRGFFLGESESWGLARSPMKHPFSGCHRRCQPPQLSCPRGARFPCQGLMATSRPVPPAFLPLFRGLCETARWPC